jgi:hypothetical protein
MPNCQWLLYHRKDPIEIRYRASHFTFVQPFAAACTQPTFDCGGFQSLSGHCSCFCYIFTTILLQDIGTLLDDFIYMIVEQLRVRFPIPRPTCYVVHMRMLNFRESVSV